MSRDDKVGLLGDEDDFEVQITKKILSTSGEDPPNMWSWDFIGIFLHFHPLILFCLCTTAHNDSKSLSLTKDGPT